MEKGDHIEEFLSYLRNVKNLSTNTLKGYQRDLENYRDFLRTRGLQEEDFDYHDAREFVRLLDGEYSEKSILRKLTCMRTYYSFLLKSSLVQENPFIHISLRRSEVRLPSVLSKSEVKRMLSYKEEGFLGERDHVLFLFLYYTGARISEALGIDITDIEWTERRIRIVGKGDKIRYLFLNRSFIPELRHYIGERQVYLAINGMKDDGALFIGKTGIRLPFSTSHIIFERYKSVLGIRGDFTPHVLRHTFATNLMDNGADIRFVQELLGHESISTTQIYTHVSKARLRNVYKDTHPHARREK